MQEREQSTHTHPKGRGLAGDCGGSYCTRSAKTASCMSAVPRPENVGGDQCYCLVVHKNEVAIPKVLGR